MSEPITVYTLDGEELIMHSPKFVKEQVKEEKLFLSPFSLTVEVDVVEEMVEALSPLLEEEE
jgi:hypothetical protein